MVKRESIKKLLFLTENIRKRILPITHVDRPAGNRVLVIAPHPEDDILGCGGTIVLHRQLGHSVNILYLTDGEKGIPSLSTVEACQRRKEETLKAREFLDVQETQLHFLHFPDGDMINHAGGNYEFRMLLESINPDVIYVPSFLEMHEDHYAANIFLKNNLVQSTSIAAYEIWTPQIPNRLVNITPVMDQKRSAMQEHASQHEILDYPDAIEGLNRYRAGMYNNGIQYAEAFLVCPSEQYFEMVMEAER